jgi:hypothetical protein
MQIKNRQIFTDQSLVQLNILGFEVMAVYVEPHSRKVLKLECT